MITKAHPKAPPWIIAEPYRLHVIITNPRTREVWIEYEGCFMGSAATVELAKRKIDGWGRFLDALAERGVLAENAARAPRQGGPIERSA